MKIYIDNAATTPMSCLVREISMQCIDEYGNPSSIHSMGRKASKALETSRNTIARFLNCKSQEIYFTASGTESCNWAIEIAAKIGENKRKKHIISSCIEHHAVLHSLEKLTKSGFEVTYIPVNEKGIVSTKEFEQCIRNDTIFATIMCANNEIGTIQPISEIGQICRDKGVLFHTDAVQAAGHLPIDTMTQNIDMLSMAAHKFHGPKGIGVLYCRKNIPIVPLVVGGGQEKGKRAGTENVAAAVGMAAALKASCETMVEVNEKIIFMRNKLINELGKIPRSRLNGDKYKRLPGIVNFCFEGIEGESLLLMLDMAGVYASSGSACASESLEPSHVLLALGLPREIAHGSLRLSLGEFNRPEEIEYIIKIVPPIIERLRNMSPLWEKITKKEG